MRRIEEATGVRRETAGDYLRKAGIVIRPPGSWGEKSLAKAATQLITGSDELMDLLATVPLLIIDDLGMRKLPLIAAEELLEIIMRRYERASTMITSNRPVEDWGKLLGDSAAVTAMLDRLLHHGHVLKCGPRSWRTKTGSNGEAQ